jgi:hypothetical protein
MSAVLKKDPSKETPMPDPEIEAMSSIADALSALEDGDARARVLRWAGEKYGVTLPQANRNGGTVHPARAANIDSDSAAGLDEEANGAATSARQFDHFAELFDAVHPKSNMEKAMTAAYWEQEINGHKDWQSQAINQQLKDLGHYDSTINRTLTSGIQAKPALVLQLKKTGAARQGRKTYRLSAEGLKFVRTRIAETP